MDGLHASAARNMPAPPEAAEVENFRQRICSNLIAEMRAQGLSPAKISRELLTIAEGLKR